MKELIDNYLKPEENELYMVFKAMNQFVKENFHALHNGALTSNETSDLFEVKRMTNENQIVIKGEYGSHILSSSRGIIKVAGRNVLESNLFITDLCHVELIELHNRIIILLGNYKSQKKVGDTSPLRVWLNK